MDNANWRGRPLTHYRTIVNLIAGTTTKTGLIVKARWDRRTYKRGVKVSQKGREVLNLKPMSFMENRITPSRPNAVRDDCSSCYSAATYQKPGDETPPTTIARTLWGPCSAAQCATSYAHCFALATAVP